MFNPGFLRGITGGSLILSPDGLGGVGGVGPPLPELDPVLVWSKLSKLIGLYPALLAFNVFIQSYKSKRSIPETNK